MKNFAGKILLLIAGMLGLLLILLAGFYALGQMRLRRTYNIPAQSVPLPSDPAAIAEGKRIFQYRGCEACHGEQLQGLVYLDNPAIGQVITPNLTKGQGGIGAQRSDADLVRSIRHGVKPDGSPLLFMPSTEFYYLSDSDLGKVLAYIRSMPPVDQQMPPSQLSTPGFILMNFLQGVTFIPAELIPHEKAAPAVPPPGVTAEYGQYLSLSCMVCHGTGMSGGEITGLPAEWPAAPNLTSGPGSRLPGWGETGFIQIIRTGEKHGRKIHPAYMPWKSYRHMTDDELRAVYTYLMSLPPRPAGNH